MKEQLFKIYILLFVVMLFISKISHSQIDSIAKTLADTIIHKLIVDDIPKKTLKDKFMYPHRWYVKQLLRPKITDFDTSYITNSKRRLTITIPISKKFYGFNIDDRNAKNKLKFSPNSYYFVGFNFSNIILTFGFVPALKLGARPGRGTTKSVDFQLTIIGRRVITDINYQNYKGFYIYNSNDFKLNSQDPELILIRPDVKVISYGVNTMFVYNYKKYSLRGSFSFTDVQRKSAGSFMTGLYHSDVVFSSSDSTFVKYPIRNYFSPLLSEINKISLITLGINGGYGYTYVYKKIILSTAVNIGVGGQKTNYTTIDETGHSLPLSISGHLNAKAALRYDNMRFFTGMLATYDTNYSSITKDFNSESYISRVVLFVGYRFNIKRNAHKLLKAMGLVDYKTK